MDKKEILQRAQRENQDDGMAAAENRGADIQRHL